MATTIGRRVGRYEILREIGRGGMATVYLARQIDLRRDVALKELTVLDGADPLLARRFLREARLAGSLGHPNIVTVYDFIEDGGTPYIAMEYMPGGSLRPHVGYLTLAQIGGVLDGLLNGLAYAEEHGVVHRDLKPENIMVTGQGSVKIADFGIAKATSAAQATAEPHHHRHDARHAPLHGAGAGAGGGGRPVERSLLDRRDGLRAAGRADAVPRHGAADGRS